MDSWSKRVSIGPSTWIVLVLLVAAASAASYFASQSKTLAPDRRLATWIASGIATTLLFSSVILVLVLIWSVDLKIPSADVEKEQKTLTFSFPESSSAGSSLAHGSQLADQRDRAARFTTVGLSDPDAAEQSKHRESQVDLARNVRREPSPLPLMSVASNTDAGVLLSGTIAEPWSATQCVVAFQIDPADETLWVLENECATAVAIVIASCDQSADQCATNATWRYRANGMMLPAKWQRPVTLDESTQVGRRIRFVACNLNTTEGARLVGTDRSLQAPGEWSDRFEAARESDECLIRVHQWSAAGHRSSRSLDALLGRLPTNSHDRD
jgi:hypothetical protein